VWLSDGEKKFENMIARFHTIQEQDRKTDRQTLRDGIGYADT